MKNIFLFLIGFILISGCKKYPEDDVFIQWKRPEKRLYKWSPWQFIRLYENGIDISSYYINDSSYSSAIDFNKKDDDNFTRSFSTVCYLCTSGSIGEYYLSEDDEKIQLSTAAFASPFGNYYFLFNGDISWDIKELDKKRFVIEGDYNGKHYRLEYEN